MRWQHPSRGLLLPVSVNLSPANLLDLRLVDKLAAAAARHGLPLRALVVEITEGIESADVGDTLTRLGCVIGQGSHLARPMPVPDFLGWLDRHDRPVAPGEQDPRQLAAPSG